MVKTRYIGLLALVVGVICLGGPARAATPQLINYQGYLKQSGVPVHTSPGTLSMQFDLYDNSVGGVLLCSSGAVNVTVTYGRFTYAIGSNGCNLSLIDWQASDVYLEVIVNGSTMTPREQIVASAYVLSSDADTLDGLDSLDFSYASGTINTSFLLDEDNIGAGVDTSLLFNRGTDSPGNPARILWDETSDIFHLTDDGSTDSFLRLQGIGLTDNLNINAYNIAATSTIFLQNTAPGYGVNVSILGDLQADGALFASNSIYATGTVYADGFEGDGSGLTGITSTDNTKVLLTGDTMTGNLTVDANIITSNDIIAATGTVVAAGFSADGSGQLITLSSAGTKFVVDDTGAIFASGSLELESYASATDFIASGNATATNIFATGYASATTYYGDGSNLTGVTGTGVAVAGDTMTGSLVINTGSATSSLGVSNTAGAGGGHAALFTSADAANISSTVYAYGASATGTVYAVNENAAGYGIHGVNNGGGAGVYGVGIYGIYGDSVGAGVGAVGRSTGTGPAAFFMVNNNVNATDTVFITTNSTDPGSSLLGGNHTGSSGNLIDLGSSAPARFTVDYDANIFATGSVLVEGNATATNIFATGYASATTYYGDGSNLTGVSGTGVAITGDTMTGSLVMTVDTATESLYIVNTDAGGGAAKFYTSNGINATNTLLVMQDGTGNAGYFEKTQAGSGAAVLGIAAGGIATAYGVQGESAGTGTGVYGYNSGTGIGVYGQTTGGYGMYATTAATGISFYGTNTGTGSLFAGNATGGGPLVNLSTGGSTSFYVDNGGAIFATGSLELESYASATDFIASGNATATNIFATGYASATTYYGDGSHLTGLPAGGGVAKTGDAMTGPLTINFSASTDTLYLGDTNAGNNGALLSGDHAGIGRLLDMAGNAGTAFIVDNGGAIFASGALEIESYASATDFIASGNATATNIFATGYASATTYYGDGSNLTGISNSGVLKTGDMMTGPLTIDYDSSTATLYVHGSGAGTLGKFEASGAAVATATLYVSTNNSVMDSTALFARHYSSGTAGRFHNSSTTNATSTVYITTFSDQAGSSLLGGNHAGAAGNFINMTAGGVDTFRVDRTGAIFASGSLELESYASATDFIASGNATATNIFATGYASATTYYGDGSNLTGVSGSGVQTTGDSMTGPLSISATGVSTETLNVYNDSTGVLYGGWQDGAGDFIYLESMANDRFVVDNQGNIYASGSLALDGTASATNIVYNTGDEIMGSVNIMATGVSTETLNVYNDSTGVLYGGWQDGAGDFIYLESMANDRFFVDNTGSIYASGSLELDGTASATNIVYNTGDEIMGSVNIAATGVSTETLNVYNDSTGVLYGGWQDGAGDFIYLESMANDRFFVDNTGSIYASGSLELDGTASATNIVYNTGDEIMGSVNIMATGVSTETLNVYNDSTGVLYGGWQDGAGDFIYLESMANDRFFVDNTGSIYASGSLELESYASATDFVASGNATATNIFATGYASATTYYGDGSNLTGVSGSGVAVTGDTMSGSLVINADSATASLGITNNSGSAAVLYSNIATPTLYVEQFTTGQAVYGYADNLNAVGLMAQNPSGTAIYGLTQDGHAGWFRNTAPGSATATVYAETISTSQLSALYGGAHTGTAGNMLYFTNGANPQFIVDRTGAIFASSSLELESYASATDFIASGNATATNIFATGYASATTYYGDGSNLTGVSGSGVAVTGDTMSGSLVINTGSATSSLGVTNTAGAGGGFAGQFENLDPANTSSTIFADNFGATSTIFISNTNSSAGSALLGGMHAGTVGNLINLSSAVPADFRVDIDGNIFASGSLKLDGNATATNIFATGYASATTYYGDGSNLTGVSGSGVAVTGDTMSGSLVINAPGVSTETLMVYTDGTGALYGGYHDGTGHYIFIEDMAGQQFIVDNTGSIFASGSLELLGTASATNIVYNTGDTITGSVLVDAPGVSTETLMVHTDGTGALYGGWHDGAGDYINIQDAGGEQFIVDNTGSIFASGSLELLGTASATNIVYNTGDEITGSVLIDAPGVSTETLMVHTDGAGVLYGGWHDGAGDYINIQDAGGEQFIVDNTGSIFASGSLELLGTASATNIVYNTGDTITGSVLIDAPGVSTETLMVHTDGAGVLYGGWHDGAGDYINIQDAGGEQFIVDNTGSIFASGSMELLGTASATNFLTSGNATATNIFATGYASATTYYGDGSHLTGVSGSGVAVTGDTMTGSLVIGTDSATASLEIVDSMGSAALLYSNSATPTLYVANNSGVAGGAGVVVENTANIVGGGHAGSFTNTGAANDDSALYASHSGATATIYAENSNADGYGVLGVNTFDGVGVYGLNENLGHAGFFKSSAPASATSTVYIYNTSTDPTSALLGGDHAGTFGSLIKMGDGTDPKFVVDRLGAVFASGTLYASGTITTDNFVIGKSFESTAMTMGDIAYSSTGSNVDGFYYSNLGTQGRGAVFDVDSVGNVYNVLTAETQGTGQAAHFETVGGGNSATATVYIETDSMNTGGRGLHVKHTGAISSEAALFESTNVNHSTATVSITTNTNDPAGMGLFVQHTGQDGYGAKFVSTNNILPNPVVVIETNSNSVGGRGLHVLHSGDASSEAAVFESTNINHSSATVKIKTSSDIVGGEGLVVEHYGSGGRAAMFTNKAPATTKDTVHIQSDSSDPSARGLYVVKYGTAGAPLWVEVDNFAHATHTLWVTTNSTQAGSALIGGDHDGTDGLLVDLRTNGNQRFAIDRYGVVSSGCPPTMVPVGDICIDNASSGGQPWRVAVDNCRTAGKHLCSAAEITMGCQQGGITFTTSTNHWTSDMAGNANAAVIMQNTTATCTVDNVSSNNTVNNSYIYYCCRNK